MDVGARDETQDRARYGSESLQDEMSRSQYARPDWRKTIVSASCVNIRMHGVE
jgi:hypothetical protein